MREIAEIKSFNANLYRQAGKMAMEGCEGLEVIFFSDHTYFDRSSENILER